MKSILDRSFRYVPSVQTDLRKTFARIRRERGGGNQARIQRGVEAQTEANVVPIKQRNS
jgi:hypothetical protein